MGWRLSEINKFASNEEDEFNEIGEALSNMKRIIDESLKNYTLEERKQMVKEIMDSYMNSLE